LIAGESQKLVPLLACWTLALLLLRLRQPRPSLRRVMLQPGMTASCAVTLTIGIISCGYVVSQVLEYRQPTRGPWNSRAPRQQLLDSVPDLCVAISRDSFSHVGLTVAGCWLIQAIGGRWRPVRSWIDRWGRWLGVLWMLVIVLGWPSLPIWRDSRDGPRALKLLAPEGSATLAWGFQPRDHVMRYPNARALEGRYRSSPPRRALLSFCWDSRRPSRGHREQCCGRDLGLEAPG
jgi:hypothetical protein